jgi:signal transduction histidine kinase/integral membrane sensor domain MASE1
MPGHWSRFWKYLATVSVLALTYFLTAELAFTTLSWLSVAPSPFWPPAGVALAAVLLKGKRVWPGVAVGAFFFARHLGVSWEIAVGPALGSTLQAVVGAQLLQQRKFRPSLTRLRDVLALLIFGAGISPLISATVSTAAGYLLGSVAPRRWLLNWWILWLGDSMGILIFTPLLLVSSYLLAEIGMLPWLGKICREGHRLGQADRQRLTYFPAIARANNLKEFPTGKCFEAAICFGILSAISWIVFASKTTLDIEQYPLEYLPFPFVVWAALRFVQPGAVLASLNVSSIAIWGTIQRVGPFVAKAENIDQAILFLHGFMVAIAITALVLAAAEAERVSATHLLKAREASLANAQRLAQLGNWDFVPGCREGCGHHEPLLWWSDELYRLFGLRPKASSPSWEQFLAVVHPEDRGRVSQAIQGLLLDRKPYGLNYRIVLPDGAERVVCERSEINQRGITGTVQDITECQRVEAQLRAAAERDRLLGEMALRIRRSLDLDRILDTTVAEVRQFLGANRVFIGQIQAIDEISERPLECSIIAESVESPYPSLRQSKNDDKVPLKELCELFERNRLCIIEDSGTAAVSMPIAAYFERSRIRAVLGVPILLGNGLYGALVANQCDRPRQWQAWEIDWLSSLATQVAIAIQQAELYRQITDLNAHLESQVEERTAELSAKMLELQELNQLKDVFLQAVSHDLRTSLLGMSMVLNNLHQSAAEVPALSRALLERMLASNERQLDLINSLLEDHFQEKRPLELHCTRLQLEGFIRDAIADWQPILARDRATLTYHSPTTLPPVVADAKQLRRVLDNLLNNALKHNPPGMTLTLTTKVEERAIRCTLEDNGVGMARQQQQSLFKLYIRGLHTQHLTGIGLGLYQCRQIIEAHDGQIGAISEPGAGSTFWFTLPLVESLPHKKEPRCDESWVLEDDLSCQASKNDKGVKKH